MRTFTESFYLKIIEYITVLMMFSIIFSFLIPMNNGSEKISFIINIEKTIDLMADIYQIARIEAQKIRNEDVIVATDFEIYDFEDLSLIHLPIVPSKENPVCWDFEFQFFSHIKENADPTLKTFFMSPLIAWPQIAKQYQQLKFPVFLAHPLDGYRLGAKALRIKWLTYQQLQSLIQNPSGVLKSTDWNWLKRSEIKDKVKKLSTQMTINPPLLIHQLRQIADCCSDLTKIAVILLIPPMTLLFALTIVPFHHILFTGLMLYSIFSYKNLINISAINTSICLLMVHFFLMNMNLISLNTSGISFISLPYSQSFFINICYIVEFNVILVLSAIIFNRYTDQDLIKKPVNNSRKKKQYCLLSLIFVLYEVLLMYTSDMNASLLTTCLVIGFVFIVYWISMKLSFQMSISYQNRLIRYALFINVLFIIINYNYV
ncbi:MAG: hypothetical protein OMM_00689 [Candidatus Magnetoglobus multicellularis str. Araruama]|uniref:Uncharacterized protein n=1 Tax=Candidatus Magnetoglobus multicellularis str. Araruama TaxID=890399 RepID=A0A1V1PGI0_9BACT|nr:MAG: hypothetical protein OMM_00689 [Candidatus Magnetoglobus multicellularis str. Araruama]